MEGVSNKKQVNSEDTKQLKKKIAIFVYISSKCLSVIDTVSTLTNTMEIYNFLKLKTLKVRFSSLPQTN